MGGATWPVSQLGKLPHPRKAHAGPSLCLQHYFLLSLSGLLPAFLFALIQETCPGGKSFQERLCCRRGRRSNNEGYRDHDGACFPQRFCRTWWGTSMCWHPHSLLARRRGTVSSGWISQPFSSHSHSRPKSVATSLNRVPEPDGKISQCRLDAVFQSLPHPIPSLLSPCSRASPSQTTSNSSGRRWSGLLLKSPLQQGLSRLKTQCKK